MDLALLIVTLILGLGVIIAYIVTFLGSSSSYWTHPFWYGVSVDTVKALSALQLLAAVGFLAAVASLVAKPAQWPASVVVATILAPAIVWPLATARKHKFCASASLVVTALGSMALVGGAFTETQTRWPLVIGSLLFANVTVLGDAVGWNARYIASNMEKE